MAKYPMAFYKTVLGHVIGFFEDQPELFEKFLDYCPKADRDEIRDLFNQY